MTRLVRHKYSGKIMEVYRETPKGYVVYGPQGGDEIDSFVMGRELFKEKWEAYKGDPLQSDEKSNVLPCGCYWTAILGRSPEHPHEDISPPKRKRGRPKGSKNKPKVPAS